MKKLGLLLAVLVLLMTGYIYKDPLATYAQNILYESSCETPKTYRIGSIDPKYNMTEDELINHIDEASDIWSGSYGNELFSNTPNGKIEINLVYDQRSLLNSRINELSSEVKLRQSELDPKIADYKKRAEEFKAKISQLNSDIEYWNNRGGAPPEEYEKLKNRQEALRNEAQTLRAQAESLNQSTEEYNQQVGNLHQTVDTFNTALQYKPEEGEYIYDNGEETINIYFDNSEAELVHTLAHELGHALGVAHNNNILSIMYPQSTESTSLTVEDKNGLSTACEKKSVIETEAEKLALIINQMRLRFDK